MDLCICHISVSLSFNSCISASYTVPIVLTRRAIWLIFTPIFLYLCSHFLNIGVVHLNNISVNQHFTGISGKFIGSGLCHLPMNQLFFFLCQPEKGRNISVSVCNRRHLSFFGSAVWGYSPKVHFRTGAVRGKWRKCINTSYACYSSLNTQYPHWKLLFLLMFYKKVICRNVLFFNDYFKSYPISDKGWHNMQRL